VFFHAGGVIGMNDAEEQRGVLEEVLRLAAGDPHAGRRNIEEAAVGAYPEFPVVGVVGDDAISGLRLAQRALCPPQLFILSFQIGNKALYFKRGNLSLAVRL
jgi:hypothetical protein